MGGGEAVREKGGAPRGSLKGGAGGEGAPQLNPFPLQGTKRRLARPPPPHVVHEVPFADDLDLRRAAQGRARGGRSGALEEMQSLRRFCARPRAAPTPFRGREACHVGFTLPPCPSPHLGHDVFDLGGPQKGTQKLLVAPARAGRRGASSDWQLFKPRPNLNKPCRGFGAQSPTLTRPPQGSPLQQPGVVQHPRVHVAEDAAPQGRREDGQHLRGCVGGQGGGYGGEMQKECITRWREVARTAQLWAADARLQIRLGCEGRGPAFDFCRRHGQGASWARAPARRWPPGR